MSADVRGCPRMSNWLSEAWDTNNKVRGCLIAFLAENDLAIYQYTKYYDPRPSCNWTRGNENVGLRLRMPKCFGQLYMHTKQGHLQLEFTQDPKNILWRDKIVIPKSRWQNRAIVGGNIDHQLGTILAMSLTYRHRIDQVEFDQRLPGGSSDQEGWWSATFLVAEKNQIKKLIHADGNHRYIYNFITHKSLTAQFQ